MKHLFRTFATVTLMFVALNSYSQNQKNTTMNQDCLTAHTINEQVSVIDKITVPANAIETFSMKSNYIRNILRQQPGFVKDQAFQQNDENGNLIVITIATWLDQQHLGNAKSVIQTEMKKAGLNMPEFLKQNGIVMERGFYHSIIE